MSARHRPSGSPGLGLAAAAAIAITMVVATVAGCDDGAKAGADSGAPPAVSTKGKVAKPSLDKSKLLADATPAKADAEAGDEFDGFDPRVVKAASVARDIEANPAKTDDVLQERGLDRDSLDTLMFEIAKDPDLTGQYRIARGL